MPGFAFSENDDHSRARRSQNDDIGNEGEEEDKLQQPQTSNQHAVTSSSYSSPPRSRSNSETSISSLFESSLFLLGSLPVAQGTSNSSKPIVHSTASHGEFELYLSSVNHVAEIELQSHLLWPSSPKLAQMIEDGIVSVRDERALELGAGSALLSLLAARMQASHVEITDYPSTPILDTIRRNVQVNLNDEEKKRVSISGLDWTDEDALLSMKERYPHGFTRILAADTLWMGHLNASQIKVMSSLLSKNEVEARIFIVAGLHTGRHVILAFLLEVLRVGLIIMRAEEVDRMEENAKGLDWKTIAMKRWKEARTDSVHARTSQDEQDDDEEIPEGIEADRRRWLVFIELAWPREQISQ